MRNYIQLLVVLIITILVFRSWFTSSIIASGDFWYIFPSMIKNNVLFYPYAWYGFAGSGLGAPGVVYQNPVIFFSIPSAIAHFSGISWPVISKLFFFIPFLIISISTSIILFRKLFPNSVIWLSAPLIFLMNTHTLMLAGGGQILLALAYSLLPLVMLSFIRLFNNDKYSFLGILCTGLLLSFQILLDLRIAYISFFGVMIYFLVKAFIDFDLRIFIKQVIKVVVVMVIIAGVHAFWIIPTIFYGIDPIKELGSDYSVAGMVKFLSFARLENTINLLHPYYPENIFGKVSFMKPEFIPLGVLAFSSLLFLKKESRQIRTYVTFFALLALISGFLAKGASEPFGDFYLWLFQTIPGFQLFRDSFKWYILISLSYSILITYVLNKIPHLLKPLLGRFGSYANIIVLLSFTIYFLFLLKPALLHELSGTLLNRDVPKEYSQLDKYLASDSDKFRTLWVPNTILFGHYTTDHPHISGKDFLREFSEKKLLENFARDSTRDLLIQSSVKYVIIPADSEDFIYLTDRKYDENKYQAVVKKLDSIPWITREKEFGKIIVYKTDLHKEHFWCDCIADISYKRINPTRYKVNVQNSDKDIVLVFAENFDSRWTASSEKFTQSSVKYGSRFNSFVIPKGSYEFEVSYAPQKIVEKGVAISLVSLSILIMAIVGSIVMKHKK